MTTQDEFTKETQKQFNVICVEQPVSEVKEETSFFQRHKKKIITTMVLTIGLGGGYAYHKLKT